jgi:hypothetical protein
MNKDLMKMPISITPISEDFHAFADGEIRFPESIKQTVDNLWRQAHSENPNLFDNSIICVKSIENNRALCATVPYRYFFVQRLQPELTEPISIKPLAVTGLITGPIGIVMGVRSSKVTQYPSCIELAPSGTIDCTNIKANGTIDFKQQLLLEMEEEIGISASLIESYCPMFLVFDPEESTYDICSRITLQPGVLEQLTKPTTNQEYSEIMVIAKDELKNFCQHNSERMVPSTMAILRHIYS